MSTTFKIFLVLLAALLAVPFVPGLIYPVFVMKVLCYGLFACAFNLLLGFTGLVSFAHAAFLGSAGYVTGALMIRFGAHPSGCRRPSRRGSRPPPSWASPSAPSRSGARASTSQ